MAVEAILLDAGGVLLLPSQERVRRVLRAVGLHPDEATVDRAHYHGIAAIDIHGHLDWDVYFRAYARCCGVAAGMDGVAGKVVDVVDVVGIAGERAAERAGDPAKDRAGRPAGEPAEDVTAEIVREVARDFGPWDRVAPGVREELLLLAGTGLRIAVVSNSPGDVEDVLRARGVCQVGDGPGVPVETVVDSGVVGVSKPDPRIFEIALDRLGVDASRTVHVGDTARIDVDGARAAGVRPVHLDPYGTCGDPDGDHDHAARLRDVLGLLD